ncbi:MAG: MFS transporter [Rubrobacteraceae bacterium]
MRKQPGGARSLALAGFLAIAVAFGPARNGFGLFLPEFRDEFGLGIEVSGFIASGLQAGYLVALSAVGLLAAKTGPRPLVVAGGLCAGAGMTLVALAPNAAVLSAGVILAGTSAGWSWAPYNDAADRMVAPSLRGRVLSIVSTGTTFGIVVAGLVALVAGAGWRSGWLIFAGAAGAATVINALVLPAGGSRPMPSPDIEENRTVARSLRTELFRRAGSGPLFSAAFVYGLISAFYWSFSVDFVERTGNFPSGGAVFFVVLGLGGFVGLFTGELVARFGFRLMLSGIFVTLGAATFLLGAFPAVIAAVVSSAALYGADVMLMSALLAMWSSATFPEQPSTGFSVTLFFFGTGSILGPALLGLLAGQFGIGGSLLISAVLALVATLIKPGEVSLQKP